jgi:hypothetical protein
MSADRHSVSGEGYSYIGRSHNVAEKNSPDVWQSRIDSAGSVEAMARTWSPKFSANGHLVEPLKPKLAYTFGPQYNVSSVYQAASIAAQEVNPKR